MEDNRREKIVEEQERGYNCDAWEDHGDHIKTIDDCFDPNLIDDCIHVFDEADAHGLTKTRLEDGHRSAGKWTGTDSSVYWSAMDVMINKPLQELCDIIQNEIIPDWCKEYPLVASGLVEKMYVSQLKLQKTRPTEGYHQWHCEYTSQLGNNASALAFMVYFNDVDEGGETEFLYQRKRIAPKANRFVVWPAGWTHIHRGNPPLSNDKYVVTGWVSNI
jgi:hypothetical protein|tara:strand:+ start:257 stop:910 length:654 start_codon:yes stop_codon:yes gene_type:complete